MDYPQSEDPAPAVFRALREADSGEDDHSGLPHESEAASPGGNDLIEDLRQQAEALLNDADKLAIAWLEEAESAREKALGLRQEADADLAAARAQGQRERDAVVEEGREQVRAEVELLMQEARSEAAKILEQAAEDGLANVRAESDQLLQEAHRSAVDIIDKAKAEADRIVAEADREQARILLDARARVDEVRSRLIRLYQEMEAASAARWDNPGP